APRRSNRSGPGALTSTRPLKYSELNRWVHWFLRCDGITIMQIHEIARRWNTFFEQKNHTVVPSASLVSPDPSLLFTVAGMVQFIPYFLGQQPPPYDRAVSVQQRLRTAAREQVATTARHRQSFQRAASFSFGDYSKERAITRAWALLATPQANAGYGLDPAPLGATVYEEDDEAYCTWRDV